MKYLFKAKWVMNYPSRIRVKDEKGNDVSLLEIVTAGVMVGKPNPEMTVVEKLRRYKLGLRLMTCAESEDQEIDLNVDEAAFIKACCAHYGIAIVGQIDDFFDLPQHPEA